MLKVEDLPLTEPGDSEVRLKVEAIGLNRADDWSSIIRVDQPLGGMAPLGTQQNPVTYI